MIRYAVIALLLAALIYEVAMQEPRACQCGFVPNQQAHPIDTWVRPEHGGDKG